MKPFYVLLSLLLLAGAGLAQTVVPRTDDTTTPLDERLAVGKTLSIPYGPTPTLNSGLAREGSLFFNTTDSLLYIYKGSAGWKAVANAESLSKYLLKTDTASLSNRINLKANDIGVLHKIGDEVKNGSLTINTRGFDSITGNEDSVTYSIRPNRTELGYEFVSSSPQGNSGFVVPYGQYGSPYMFWENSDGSGRTKTPIMGNVVHTAGNESIFGNKTFQRITTDSLMFKGSSETATKYLNFGSANFQGTISSSYRWAQAYSSPWSRMLDIESQSNMDAGTDKAYRTAFRFFGRSANSPGLFTTFGNIVASPFGRVNSPTTLVGGTISARVLNTSYPAGVISRPIAYTGQHQLFTDSTTIHLVIAGGNASGKELLLDKTQLTDHRTVTFPDKSGTIAMLSDITSSTADTTTLHKVGNETATGNKTFQRITTDSLMFSGSSTSLPKYLYFGRNDIVNPGSRTFRWKHGTGREIASLILESQAQIDTGINMAYRPTVSFLGRSAKNPGWLYAYGNIKAQPIAPNSNPALLTGGEIGGRSFSLSYPIGSFARPVNNGGYYSVFTDSLTKNLVITGGNNASKELQLNTSTFTDHRTVTFPDKSGTLALTSDISPAENVYVKKLENLGKQYWIDNYGVAEMDSVKFVVKVDTVNNYIKIGGDEATTTHYKSNIGIDPPSLTFDIGNGANILRGPTTIIGSVLGLNNGAGKAVLLNLNDSHPVNSGLVLKFPKSNGTLALTSDLTSFVDKTSNQSITGTKVFKDIVRVEHPSNSAYSTVVGPTSVNLFTDVGTSASVSASSIRVEDQPLGSFAELSNSGYLRLYRNNKGMTLGPAILTGTRNITFPDASGTITLNENLKTINGNSIIGTGDLSLGINESDLVHKSGAETISGSKTFSGGLSTTGLGTLGYVNFGDKIGFNTVSAAVSIYAENPAGNQNKWTFRTATPPEGYGSAQYALDLPASTGTIALVEGYGAAGTLSKWVNPYKLANAVPGTDYLIPANLKTINGNSIVGAGNLTLDESNLVHKTSNESIDGTKTFTSAAVLAQGARTLNGSGYIANLNGTDGYASLFGNGLSIDNGTAYPRKTQYDLDYITHINASNKVYSLKFPTDITEDQLVKLPSTGGTLAVTSDLTDKANLSGGNTFSGVQTFSGEIKSNQGFLLKEGTLSTAPGYMGLNAIDANTLKIGRATFNFPSGLFGYTYTLQGNSGTLAYLSDIPDVSTKANLSGGNTFSGVQTFDTAPKINLANMPYINPIIDSYKILTLRQSDNTVGFSNALPAGGIGTGVVDNTEFSYLDNVTSPIQAQINAKQNTLVSGTNIKTINGNSIIGSGDLTVTPTYGTTAGTVAQGNDSRIINGQTAFGWGNHANAGYANNTGVVHVTGAETVAGIKTFTDQTVLNGALSGTSASFSGKVGIGTTNPDMALTVKGKIHAEEVKVDLNVPGPDYVFEKDYDLKSLKEVEKYITANKHLPEIPSAKTMEKEGISMGDMQMKLLQKVEELTLYIIEQNKRADKQQEKADKQDKIISELQKQIEELKSKK